MIKIYILIIPIITILLLFYNIIKFTAVKGIAKNTLLIKKYNPYWYIPTYNTEKLYLANVEINYTNPQFLRGDISKNNICNLEIYDGSSYDDILEKINKYNTKNVILLYNFNKNLCYETSIEQTILIFLLFIINFIICIKINNVMNVIKSN